MKLFISVLLLSVNVAPSLAQKMGMTGFKYHWTRPEILAGPSIASIRYGNLHPGDQPRTTIGFGVGIQTRYIISNRFQLVGSILFERKGGKQVDDVGTYDSVTQIHGVVKGASTYVDRYDYLTLPILINYLISQKRSFKIGLGPYVAYLLKARISWEDTVSHFKYTLYETSNYSKMDAGISTAFEVDVRSNKKYIASVKLTTNWGLVNIIKPVVPDHQKTRVFYIMIVFPLAKIF